MYAVIFKATVAEFSEAYYDTASALRKRAFSEYGCLDFLSCTEGDQEIAVSYWNNLEQIQRWKQDVEHLTAQHQGRSMWYADYTVEVVEIVRSYGKR